MDVLVTFAYPYWVMLFEICFYLFLKHPCTMVANQLFFWFSTSAFLVSRPTLLDAGENVEYFGAKMQRWIPAKVETRLNGESFTESPLKGGLSKMVKRIHLFLVMFTLPETNLFSDGIFTYIWLIMVNW